MIQLFRDSDPFGSSRLNAESLPSTRAQAEGLKVHPEPRFFTPPSKTGLRAAERVKKRQLENTLKEIDGQGEICLLKSFSTHGSEKNNCSLYGWPLAYR